MCLWHMLLGIEMDSIISVSENLTGKSQVMWLTFYGGGNKANRTNKCIFICPTYFFRNHPFCDTDVSLEFSSKMHYLSFHVNKQEHSRNAFSERCLFIDIKTKTQVKGGKFKWIFLTLWEETMTEDDENLLSVEASIR